MLIMRNCWLLLMFLSMCSVACRAADYYVAKTGTDTNPGTQTQPFLTIQKAAGVMYAGDTCHVREGTYRETVRPSRSGSPGRPIRFQAYPGENVTVSGADLVTGWTQHSGSIYKASVTGSFDQLFVDGQMMNEARWPNSGLDLLQPTFARTGAGTICQPSGLTSIVDPNLNQPAGTWVGATLYILAGAGNVGFNRTVTGYNASTHTITCNWFTGEPYYMYEGFMPITGNSYYLTGVLAALDSACEWYCGGSPNYAYLWVPDGGDPEHHVVEVKRRANAFNLSSRSYVEIAGFNVFSSGMTLDAASHCLVERCHLKYLSHFDDCSGWGTHMYETGIVVGGNDNKVRKCHIAYSAGAGVTLTGTRNTVENCLIHDCDYMNVVCCPVITTGTGHIISRNTMYNSGMNIIALTDLKQGLIEFNDMHDCGLISTDCGVTSSYHMDGQGTVIRYNWAYRNHAYPCGMGIYLDQASSNYVVHHNVSWGHTMCGITMNTPSANLVYNNTVYGNPASFSYWAEYDDDMTGSVVVNNVGPNPATFGPGVVLSNNFFYSPPSDPRFVSPLSYDFRLQAASPCVNAGKVIPGITDGYVGSAPDIGAYEYGGEYWIPGCEWSIMINSDAMATSIAAVTLDLSAGEAMAGAVQMQFSGDGSIWTGWEPVVSSRSWTLSGGDGTKKVYARYRDGSGNVSRIHYDSIIFDTAPPSAPGTPSGGEPYTTASSITFTWTAASDVGSGIVGYNCRIGTTPDGSDVFDSFVDNVLGKTITAANGKTYYCRVQAIDNAGNVGPWSAISPGTMRDISAPGAPGTPVDAGLFTDDSSITFTWAPASDSGSGVATYYCQVGTTQGSYDVFSGYVGNVLSKIITSVEVGRSYYCRVFAKDNVGIVGPWSAGSDGIMVVQATPSSIGQGKGLAEGTVVGLTEMIVTAIFGDGLYIEETCRTSGMKVVPVVMPAGLAVGSAVDVAGTIAVDANGERIISGARVSL